jgi:nucleotide-binding universal stress UspA family protein
VTTEPHCTHPEEIDMDVPAPEGRIVVGVDGSPVSLHAARWACRQATLTGAHLELVTAWHVPVFVGYPGAGGVALAGIDWEGGARATLGAAVEELADVLPEGTTRRVLHGHAATVLVHAAEGADLLVVGSRGHGGFAGMLLGSVSEHVTAHSPCPVLVVRQAQAAAA